MGRNGNRRGKREDRGKSNIHELFFNMLNALLGMPNTHLILTISSQDVFLLLILKIKRLTDLKQLAPGPQIEVAERSDPSSPKPPISSDTQTFSATLHS